MFFGHPILPRQHVEPVLQYDTTAPAPLTIVMNYSNMHKWADGRNVQPVQQVLSHS